MKHLLTFITLVLSLLVISACGDGSNDNSGLCANYLYYIDGKCTCLDGKNQLGEACTNPFDKPPVIDGDDATTDGDDAVIDGDATITDGDTVDVDVVDDPNTITAHGITLQVATIPAGTFEMGCSPDDANCQGGEKPVHTVNIKEFKMSKSEITNVQYAQFLEYNTSNCIGIGCLSGYDPDLTRPTHPASDVSRYGAMAFCDAMGGRLPTEAEWEYAARAGTTAKYYCDGDPSCIDSIAWHAGNVNSDYTPHPVCTKTANDFGLCDMLGNVWERTADLAYRNYTDAPTDGSAWFVNSLSAYHMLRGGSVLDTSDVGLRVSYRGYGFTPGKYYIGFRCVFAEKDIVDIDWISISAESFEMGCISGDESACGDYYSYNDDDGDKQFLHNEAPVHTVDISAFDMMQTEVTYAQFAKLLTDNNYMGEEEEDFAIPYHIVFHGDKWCIDGGSDLYPVVNVTYGLAETFCEMAGGRLPSEAEWEYAARAKTSTHYYCGDDENCLDDIVCNTSESDWIHCRVGTKTPNDFELYDMIGNTSEMIADCWHYDYTDAPTDGSAWTTDCYPKFDGTIDDPFHPTYDPDVFLRLYRGEDDDRVSHRSYLGEVFSASPYANLGFRCVRDAQ